MNILPQITQITQRNAAKLHYFAEKDRLELSLFCGYCCFAVWGLGFCLRYQRDLRETLGFFCDRLSTLACYSPADSADSRRLKTGWGNETNNNNGRSRVSRGKEMQKLKKFA